MVLKKLGSELTDEYQNTISLLQREGLRVIIEPHEYEKWVRFQLLRYQLTDPVQRSLSHPIHSGGSILQAGEPMVQMLAGSMVSVDSALPLLCCITESEPDTYRWRSQVSEAGHLSRARPPARASAFVSKHVRAAALQLALCRCCRTLHRYEACIQSKQGDACLLEDALCPMPGSGGPRSVRCNVSISQSAWLLPWPWSAVGAQAAKVVRLSLATCRLPVQSFADVATAHDPKPFFLTLKATDDPSVESSMADFPKCSSFCRPKY